MKQEHGKCGTSQCKWPCFERCLVIWGKITKAWHIVRSMDNNVPNDLVCGFTHVPVNLEDTKEHDVPLPNKQVLPFTCNSSQVSKNPLTLRLITCKKPRVDGKPNKRCKRLNDESIGLAEALFEFAKSSTKIEVMKIEVQK